MATVFATDQQADALVRALRNGGVLYAATQRGVRVCEQLARKDLMYRVRPSGRARYDLTAAGRTVATVLHRTAP